MIAVMTFMTAQAEYSKSYYSRMDGKKKEALKSAAKECVKNHKSLGYYDLPDYWQYSDVYPELVNGCKRWWEMYSDREYLIRAGQSGRSSFSANHMQREHSVPKSWWKVGNDVEYTPAYTDMWNLYPSDGDANMAKSNFPLGICDPSITASFDNGVTKVGVPAFGYGGGAACVFEPADEYKGDFARSFFYMATVYDDLSWSSRYDWMFARQSYPTLASWAYEMLLQWARQDQVSQKEILRNDAVEKSQGNRNPFVDFPELAEYIWGTRTQEVFYIDDQTGSNVTPPITGDPELTAPVNDEWLDFGQVAVGGMQTSYLVIKGKNFTSPLSVRTGGTDRNLFTISERTIPASAINSTGEYMLAIQYTPSSVGEHSATLGIYDGGLEGSIRVNLKGTGCPMPVLSQPHALPAADVSGNVYTASWQPVAEEVDFYVFYRTRYLPDGAETETIDTNDTSLRITDRDPSVAESYQVASSRLGFLSQKSNVINVEASSGVNEISDIALMIASDRGGLRVLTSESAAEIEVFRTDGVRIGRYESLSHGDFIPLGGGVYIVTSALLNRPVKVIVE